MVGEVSAAWSSTLTAIDGRPEDESTATVASSSSTLDQLGAHDQPADQRRARPDDDPAFAAELPIIACFHDMEPATHGTEWIAEQLDAWEGAGAKRIIGLGDLADALDARLAYDGERVDLGPAPRCPIPVQFSSPA